MPTNTTQIFYTEEEKAALRQAMLDDVALWASMPGNQYTRIMNRVLKRSQFNDEIDFLKNNHNLNADPLLRNHVHGLENCLKLWDDHYGMLVELGALPLEEFTKAYFTAPARDDSHHWKPIVPEWFTKFTVTRFSWTWPPRG